MNKKGGPLGRFFYVSLGRISMEEGEVAFPQ